MDELSLRCRCGAMRGRASRVSPDSGSHVVCYCDDCQAFARWLGSDGLVDSYGGTKIFQLSPAQVAINEGQSELRCVRLSANGLYRFYAACCRTHVGNALSSRVPFIGLSRAFMETSAGDPTIERLLGPTSSILGRFAPGGLPPGAHARAPARLLLKSARLLLGWWLRGKGKPSPLFDDEGAPRVEPEVLTLEARVPLYATVSWTK